MDAAVIIAAGPAADLVLESQLDALNRQDYKGAWEVVIANNGCDPRALGTVLERAGRRLRVRVVNALEGIGCGYAKNVGGWRASADRLAFCDADDVVDNGWLRAMMDGLDDHSAVTGPLGRVPYEAVEMSSPEQLFRTTTFTNSAPVYRGIVFASGCNCAFRREAILEGYAANYIPVAWEDVATSFRAYVLGYPVGWSPQARILYRARPRGTPMFRRSVTSGVGQRKLDREFDGVLWAARGARLTRRTAWLGLNTVRLGAPGFREAWRWEAGATLGVAVEHFLPGAWAGRFAVNPTRALGVVANPVSDAAAE